MVPEELDDPADLTPDAEADRTAAIDELNKLMDEMSGWQFRLGPVRMAGYFNSMRFARYFVCFHVLVGFSGAVLIFFGGALRDLGMAMVVGALFGFGAFVAQVWTVQVEKEHAVRFGQHGEKHRELVQKLKALE